MCLNRLRLVVVTNSLSECSIIVCLAMKSLWIWIATFWLNIVSSSYYKVGRCAWPYETLCLAGIPHRLRLAHFDQMFFWSLLSQNYPVYCVSCGQHPCFFSTSVQSRWFPGFFWNCRGLCLSMSFLDLPYYSFNLTCIGLPVPLM